MNPLSPLTYYRRHKRQTLLLVGLVSLMTLGVFAMVRLLDSVPENYQIAGNYLTRVSLVSASGPSLDPGVGAQIRTHAGIAHVIQEKGLDISLPPIISEHHLFGVSETDMQALMDACNLRLREGRLPRPSTNEMVLSETMARGAKVWLGDELNSSDNQDWLVTFPSPLVVVGILEDDPYWGIRLIQLTINQ